MWNTASELGLRVPHYHRYNLVLFIPGHSSCSYTFHRFRFAFAAKLAVFLLILLATIFSTVPLHVTLLAPVIRHFAAQTEILAILWYSEMKERVVTSNLDYNYHITTCVNSNQRYLFLSRSVQLQIGHFRVLLCLCFKTSLSAKPFIWKWVLHAVSFSCKSKSFS